MVLIKNKKASTSGAIVMLGFIVLFLIGFSLFTFLTGAKSVRDKIISYSILEKTYALQEQINFHFEQGLDLEDFPDFRLFKNKEITKQGNSITIKAEDSENKIKVTYTFTFKTQNSK